MSELGTSFHTPIQSLLLLKVNEGSHMSSEHTSTFVFEDALEIIDGHFCGDCFSYSKTLGQILTEQEHMAANLLLPCVSISSIAAVMQACVQHMRLERITLGLEVGSFHNGFLKNNLDRVTGEWQS